MADLSRSIFESFLRTVVRGAVFSAAERDRTGRLQPDKIRKDIAAGRRIEDRTPFLMTISGKGGYAEGDAFATRRFFRNVTLLDHLVSVTRGAAVFAELDLQATGIGEDAMRIRVVRVMATAFLHDADKMLALDRRTMLDEEAIAGLMNRYRIDAFLRDYEASLDPIDLLSRINAVEVSRSGMFLPRGRILPLEESKDCLYVRLADRLDGCFLDMRRPLEDIPAEIAAFEGLRTDALKKGWRSFRIRSPHTPFLLDEMQGGFSAAVFELTGIPPLVEVHHDGELLLVCQAEVAEQAMDVAIERAGSRLSSGLRVQTNARGSRDILDGGSSFRDLLDVFDKEPKEAAKALYVHVDVLATAGERFENTFDSVGFPPSLEGLAGFAGKHYQPWPLLGQDERLFAVRRDAAALAVGLGCVEPHDRKFANRVPDAAAREAELVAHLAEHQAGLPDWIESLEHRGSRQTLISAWAAVKADSDQALRMALLGEGGLLAIWLGGTEGRAGLLQKIEDLGSAFIGAAHAWLQAASARRFLPADHEDGLGRCHFTNLPVGSNTRIDGKSGIDGVKVSAFSGREGRPESHESAKAQTLVSPFAAAEHRLRTLLGEGRSGEVPAHVSSPTSMGLFATLNLDREIDGAFHDINHYDLLRLEQKGDRPVYPDTENYGARVAFARHIALPSRTADIITLVRMMMKASLRLGRPVHVFQGLPQPEAGFVHFDFLPSALKKAFGGRSLRLEQLPEMLDLLAIAEQLLAKDMSNIGLEVVLRLLDPVTRFAAACEAILILDRLPDDKATAHRGLRTALWTIARKDHAMPSDSDRALIDFARAMTRVQAAPRRDASNNVRSLGLRIALDAVEGCLRIGQTAPESLTAAIAGQLEDEFERSARLEHRGTFHGNAFPRPAAMDAAKLFVESVWPFAFRSRPPASKDRRIAFAIYQVAFEAESYRRKAVDMPAAEIVPEIQN